MRLLSLPIAVIKYKASRKIFFIKCIFCEIYTFSLSKYAIIEIKKGGYSGTFEKQNIPIVAVPNDIDGDGVFSSSDVWKLQKWVLASEQDKMAYAPEADVNKDGVVDVFDLALMKRALLEQQKTENEEFLS